MKIVLVGIDPQNDFADPTGALSVAGGDVAMTNMANLVNTMGDKLNQVHVTLDSHHEFDIAHPAYWIDSNGNHPAPFTTISHADTINGVWRPAIAGLTAAPNLDPREYTRKLEANGRYQLTIWPTHCVIGSWGNSIYPTFSDAIRNWERLHIGRTGNFVNYVAKGEDFRTEHYGAVCAEVPYDNNPTTQMNTGFISLLADPEIDLILFGGLATDYCLKTTIEQIADQFGDDNIKKMVLLEDCAAGIDPNASQAFISNMSARGMKVAKSTDDLVALAL
jgi:nicotinamidase/pyrazinamidase